jgi:hypothetical protein
VSDSPACLDYSLQLAKKYVVDYNNMDDVMRQHQEVMRCCDECEAFLRSGIDAYTWLQRAEFVIQQAAREGIAVPKEIPDAIDLLYRTWLAPCDRAEQHIKRQQELGYEAANLKEFRNACEQVKKRIQAIDTCDAIDDAFSGKVFDASFWAEAAGSPSL